MRSHACFPIGTATAEKTRKENTPTIKGKLHLDIYGHATQRMKQESAERMEAFIKQVSNL